jgi:hypothetical protein
MNHVTRAGVRATKHGFLVANVDYFLSKKAFHCIFPIPEGTGDTR